MRSLFLLYHDARYAQHYFLKARAAGFTMAAQEYKEDRDKVLQTMRAQKTKMEVKHV